MEEQILAEQLIFTRVEPPYSPGNTSGYQTVYRSAGLQTNLVEEIEKRVRCYQTQRERSVERIQFFQVGNLYALSQTVPIRPHPEIVDKTKRDGAFMVHCLLLDKNSFAAIEYNPFHIFTYPGYFYTSIEAIIEKFGQATGLANRHELRVRKQAAPQITWPANEVIPLTKLAFAAKQISQNNDSLLLVGDQPAIREALQYAFSLIPPSDRIACTFDSYITGCPTPPGTYWAVGTTTSISQKGFIQIDANRHKVAESQSLTIPDNEYTRWLSPILQEGRIEDFQEQASTVQSLYEAAHHNVPLNRDNLTVSGCEAFYQSNKKFVVQYFKTILMTKLNPTWANLLVPFAFQEYRTDSLVPIAVSQDLTDNELTQILADYLIDTEQPEVKDSDWRLVQILARKAQDHRLLHWASTLMTKVDKETRDQSLTAMDEVEYENALKKLLRPISPEHFVAPKHLSLLIDSVLQRNMTDEQFVALVESLLNSHQPHHLTKLTPRAKTVDKNHLKKLEKSLNKRRQIPADFRQAVERRKKETSPSFLKDRMLGLLRSKKE